MTMSKNDNNSKKEIIYIEKDRLGKSILLPQKKEITIIILNRNIKLSGGKKWVSLILSI